MPDWKSELRARLASSKLSPERELEIVEELSQHLEDQYERALSRGLSEEEAYRAALEELETPESLGQQLSRIEVHGPRNQIVPGSDTRTNFIGDVAQDLRYALRMLVKNLGFAIVAIVALALGIGANSAIFSVVNTVLLRPLPFKEPGQLVMVWDNNSHLGFPRDTPTPANFLDWRRQNTVFHGMAAIATRSFNLTGAGEPERLDCDRVSADLFDLLGVQPVVGRNFVAAEDKPGTHVVILSYGVWQRRFGADPRVIGQSVTLSGESYTVVGVMPANFQLPVRTEFSAQLWVPIAFRNDEAAQRGSHYLYVIARIKPGLNLAQARAKMDAIAAHLARQYPQENLRMGAVVVPLHEQLVGDIKPALLLLLGAVGFVLLIACANVANLLLARAAVRQKEIALRLALGASRSRLARQFLTESVLLALIGGGLGLFLAFEGIEILKSFIPPSVSQSAAIAIDGRVLLFTMLVSLVTGIIFGLAPVGQLSHLDLNDTLKEASRDSSGGGKAHRLRGILVVAEVAVSFILLIGAGLLINSFVHLRNLDPGFNPDHLLTVKVNLTETRYPDTEGRAKFFHEVVPRVQELPGVKAVAIADNLPLTYDGNSFFIGIEGRPDPPPDQRLDVVLRIAGPGYFSTMQIPFLKGRDLTEDDRPDTNRVVIISEKTAERYWPGEDPIGKRLKPGLASSDVPWRTVIGVVKDVRQNDFIATPKPEMYWSYQQVQDFPPNALVIRTNIDPLSLAPSVRSAIWSIDKDQPVSEIRTMDEIVSQAIARQRFSMLLLGIFAAVALLLAAVGIYGVMSYSVAQRTREIGIRIALGAKRADVLKLIVTQGLRLVGLGLAIGLAAGFLLTRAMSSLLFGISATDPFTYLSISTVLLAVAMLASYLPALRATRVDPMLALRAQ
jgi:predicted permease